jgi:uncharacterized protein
MNRYFVDTNFWVALCAPSDQDHKRAKRIFETIDVSDELVSSEFVMIEFFNYFSDRDSDIRKFTASFFDRLDHDEHVQLVPLSSSIYRRAILMYSKYADKGWSLTDSTSFLIMQEMKIEKALSFDHHFEQAGFQRKLD